MTLTMTLTMANDSEMIAKCHQKMTMNDREMIVKCH